jgi:hypothetical protein
MAHYRNKPKCVEAVQLLDVSYEAKIEDCFSEFPHWLQVAIDERRVSRIPGTSFWQDEDSYLVRGGRGDWVVKTNDERIFILEAKKFDTDWQLTT